MNEPRPLSANPLAARLKGDKNVPMMVEGTKLSPEPNGPVMPSPTPPSPPIDYRHELRLWLARAILRQLAREEREREQARRQELEES